MSKQHTRRRRTRCAVARAIAVGGAVATLVAILGAGQALAVDGPARRAGPGAPGPDRPAGGRASHGGRTRPAGAGHPPAVLQARAEDESRGVDRRRAGRTRPTAARSPAQHGGPGDRRRPPGPGARRRRLVAPPAPPPTRSDHLSGRHHEPDRSARRGRRPTRRPRLAPARLTAGVVEMAGACYDLRCRGVRTGCEPPAASGRPAWCWRSRSSGPPAPGGTETTAETACAAARSGC